MEFGFLGLILFFGFRCMMDQWEWFWNPSSYHDAYPNNLIPRSVELLYSVEIAHYVYSLLVIFWDPPMKDFWVMVAHHLFTLSLLTSSYRFGATRYGTVIMLLHDVADPFMELAKLFLYSSLKTVRFASLCVCVSNEHVGCQCIVCGVCCCFHLPAGLRVSPTHHLEHALAAEG